MVTSAIKERLSSIPTQPGVYLLKGENGDVLYIGKAINLRSRVRSYFHASVTHPPKLQHLVWSVADVDFIVTDSELEALILECNLIKRYRPHFNVRLKDDKRYPYVKVTWQEDFPRIEVVRRVTSDGARYFGPYTSSSAMRQTLELLRRIFPYLTCNRKITGTDDRACLYYHIKRCLGPCIGAVSKEEYREMMNQVCLFLQGKGEEIVSSLKGQMESAAEAMAFERAASLRDQIEAIEQVTERQRVVSSSMSDQDAVAFARRDGETCVQVFFVRGGKLVGREYFLMDGAEDVEPQEILASFIKQFYDHAAYVPPEVLLPAPVDEARLIEQWLRDKRGTRVLLRVPRRGAKRALVDMVVENATQTLSHLMAREQLEKERAETALGDLQAQLGLSTVPSRIEAYDISNIQGTAATGSMVVFVEGAPLKSQYRRFRIRTVHRADDYAMMQEILRRRFRRAIVREAVAENTWAQLPDLVVIDGGKGQLNAALEVRAEYGLEDMPIVGLAKAREEIFMPGEREPVSLPLDSPALQLMQHMRDEAHRFAISYHQRLRRQEGLSSVLEEIPGIGPKRRQALLKRFGSVGAIQNASVEELAAVQGMNKTMARRVQEYL
ncbi:MAG: excinuclease ABC subunit UvrC [Anaerolineae bacterium]|nr:excinuclease ABC subunit UvrC [Anaerolineae bacterium]NIQ82785.1 excinuclease ABC subunit UvrC [Anaerolineae bacterium]